MNSYFTVIPRAIAHKHRQRDCDVADKNGKSEKEYPNDEGGTNWIYISGLKPFQKLDFKKKRKRGRIEDE